MNQEKPTRYVIFLIAIIGAVVFLQMCMQLIHQWSDIDFNRNLNLLFAQLIKDIWLNHSLLELFFNGVIGFTMVKMVWHIIKQIYLHRKWNAFFKSKKHDGLTRKLNKKYSSWGTTFLVVRDSSFFALSMGLFHPKIVISTGLLNVVHEKEQRAILYHERYHCHKFDPLKMVVITLIMNSMSYVPALKGLVQYYKIWKELLADRFVIQQMGSALELGNALLKMISLGKREQQNVGVHFGETAIHYRIQQITEPKSLLRIPFVSFKSLLCSLVVLLMMMFISIGGHL